jgi:hypothetical protein
MSPGGLQLPDINLAHTGNEASETSTYKSKTMHASTPGPGPTPLTVTLFLLQWQLDGEDKSPQETTSDFCFSNWKQHYWL